MRKKRFINLSPIRRKLKQAVMQSKPLQYGKALSHIILKIQPFFTIFIALLVTLPLSFAVTFAVDKISTPEKDNIYKEGIIGTFSRIDPLPQAPLDKPFSQINRDITRLLFNPLFSSDAGGNIVNVMAESFEVGDNGSKYTVKIKPGKWSDGTIITSKDILATFTTIKNTGSGGLYYAAIDGVEVSIVDDSTVLFSLAIPNGTFLDTLYWPILPASKLSLKYDDLLKSDFSTKPITSTDWQINNITKDSVTLKNSKISKGIQFIFYNDISELEKAVNGGFIDGYYSYNKVSDKNYINVSTYVLPRQLYSIYFNMSDTASDVIKDPNIRKAISYALDRQAITDVYGVPQQSVISDKSWAFNPAVDTYTYNLDKANKTLEDAGFKFDGDYRKSNGKDLEFTLTIPELNIRVKQANVVVDQLKKIGIKVNVKPIKDSQFIDNSIKGNIFYKSVVLTKNFDAMIYSVDSSLDPDKFSQWHSSKVPDPDKNILGLNFTGYSDFRVDEYLRGGRSKYDQTARKTSYFQFQKVFYDDPPVVTLYNPYLFYATSKKVKNIDFTGSVRIEDRFMNFDKWIF